MDELKDKVVSLEVLDDIYKRLKKEISDTNTTATQKTQVQIITWEADD